MFIERETKSKFGAWEKLHRCWVGGWRGKASDGWNASLVERQVVEKQVATFLLCFALGRTFFGMKKAGA